MVKFAQDESLDAPRHFVAKLGLRDFRHYDPSRFVYDLGDICDDCHADPQADSISDLELFGEKLIAPRLDNLLNDQSVGLLVPVMELIAIIDVFAQFRGADLRHLILPLLAFLLQKFFFCHFDLLFVSFQKIPVLSLAAFRFRTSLASKLIK
mmetsp:Transcript_11211/g.15111  ORF Transcript_11211/g.15111 Transcript_11211/m.15111 type:complete len:152 (-) Transcript_11211:418-873(-)